VAAETILNQTELSVSADTSFFLQIAKVRAMRLLMIQFAEAYGVKEGNFHLHVRTARWNKFRQDAYNNIIRSTLEGMAAVLGGCDLLTVEPYNIHFSEPDAPSRRIARNVHAILREESYLAKVADPAAGTYFIENLTHALAAEAWKLFQAVEAGGGYRVAWQSGFFRREIDKVRTEKENAIRQGRMVLVGINKYLPADGIATRKAI
jgi:methylmalonyl-CoA mutase